ncbi:MAG TPA: DUF443 family protein [Pseudogracilibacillus sp.]|nr:DUF443 family protein [Pseudogracilibacillus sp.]
MNNEVHRVKKNFRYRIFTIKGNAYLVDMDQPLWIIFFPVIYWLLPHTVYKIDEDTFHKLKFGENIQGDRRKTDVNLLVIGGLAMILSNLLRYMAEFFRIEMTKGVSIGIVLLAGLIIFSVRLYMSMVSERTLEKEVTLKNLPRERILFRPSSRKDMLLTVFFFLFLLVLVLGSALFFISFQEPFAIFSFTVGLLFYFMLGAANVTFEDFKVNFRSR